MIQKESVTGPPEKEILNWKVQRDVRKLVIPL